MAALKILQDFREQARHCRRIERQHPFDHVIGAGVVGNVEIARLGRWFEAANEDSCGIRTQVESLAVQERDL